MTRLGFCSFKIQFAKLFRGKLMADVGYETLQKRTNVKKKLKLTSLALRLLKYSPELNWLLSRVFWFPVSRNFLFYQENKNSNIDNFLPELDKNPPTSSKILRIL